MKENTLVEAGSLNSKITADDTVVRFRRIVTGHDENGKSIFVEDATCEHINCLSGLTNFTNTEFWKTMEMPVDNSGEADDNIHIPRVPPFPNGAVFRIMQFPPNKTEFLNKTMHATATIDFCYIIKGEIAAVLDDSEKVMKEGDVLIQRGTAHAWVNRSNEPCIILFVLIDAKPLTDEPAAH